MIFATSYNPWLTIFSDGTVRFDFRDSLENVENDEHFKSPDYKFWDFNAGDDLDTTPEVVQQTVAWMDEVLAAEGTAGLLRKIADQLDEQEGA